MQSYTAQPLPDRNDPDQQGRIRYSEDGTPMYWGGDDVGFLTEDAYNKNEATKAKPYDPWEMAGANAGDTSQVGQWKRDPNNPNVFNGPNGQTRTAENIWNDMQKFNNWQTSEHDPSKYEGSQGLNTILGTGVQAGLGAAFGGAGMGLAGITSGLGTGFAGIGALTPDGFGSFSQSLGSSAGGDLVGGAAAGEGIPGGFQNSMMNNPSYGLDMGQAGLGSYGPNAVGTNSLGDIINSVSQAGGAGAAAEGGGLWDMAKSFMDGITPKDMLSTGLQAYTLGKLGTQLRGIGQQTLNAPGTRALTEPERAPYQGNLSTLVNNPSQYLSSDPFATSLAALYKDKVIPTAVAKSGNPSQVLDEKGSQFVNAIAGNYNAQMQNLGNISGFGFAPSGYAPAAFGQASTLGAQYQSQPLSTLGNLLGNNKSSPAQGSAGTTGLFGSKVS